MNFCLILKIYKKKLNNEKKSIMYNELLIIFRDIINETFVFIHENISLFDSNVD